MKKRFKITLCVLCTLLLIPMVALAESETIGTIYYIANDGNDENSGTSPDDAWQTLDKINSEHFSPGDSILFKRNDYWRGHLIPQSGSADGYVTYGAYGTGNKPLLLGSIEKNDLNDWIYEGNDIWAYTIPGTPYDIGNIIFDNEQLCGVKKWDEENLDAQGDFWYDEENSVIKIYSIDNPASYYSDIECALTTTIIDQSNKNYVIYENLELKYGGAHGIGGGNTHHIIVRDCDLSYIGGGKFPYDYQVRFGNGIEFWGNAHDNLVERCRIWEIYDSALTNQNNSPNQNQYNISYQNNIIWNCEWSYEFWNLDENSFMYDISFVNNTCAYAGGGWGHSQRPDPWGLHVLNYANITDTGKIRIINNIFYESTENCIYISSAYDGLENLNLDYNCWYQASGNMMNFQGYRYTMSQFSMYQSAKSQDQNSIAEAPLFTNLSETDFHPQENSPVIDHGLSFDVPEADFDRNCRYEGIDHDMGAYEFIFNVPPVNIPPTADAGQDQTVFEGDTVTLDGSASMDPDDGIAFIQWTQTSGTSVALSDPEAWQPQFTAPAVGGEDQAITFQLTVTDMAGLTSQDTCVVTVQPTAQILPPAINIKANGQGGFVTVSRRSSVSISINIDPGDLRGKTADLWLLVDSPQGRFFYVYENGWQGDPTPFIQYPLDELVSYEAFNTRLPKGDYFFHFAIDDNADGIPDGTWLDTVSVQVR